MKFVVLLGTIAQATRGSSPESGIESQLRQTLDRPCIWSVALLRSHESLLALTKSWHASAPASKDSSARIVILGFGGSAAAPDPGAAPKPCWGAPGGPGPPLPPPAAAAAAAAAAAPLWVSPLPAAATLLLPLP
jgi:hypothetical protein